MKRTVLLIALTAVAIACGAFGATQDPVRVDGPEAGTSSSSSSGAVAASDATAEVGDEPAEVAEPEEDIAKLAKRCDDFQRGAPNLVNGGGLWDRVVDGGPIPKISAGASS